MGGAPSASWDATSFLSCIITLLQPSVFCPCVGWRQHVQAFLHVECASCIMFKCVWGIENVCVILCLHQDSICNMHAGCHCHLQASVLKDSLPQSCTVSLLVYQCCLLGQTVFCLPRQQGDAYLLCTNDVDMFSNSYSLCAHTYACSHLLPRLMGELSMVLKLYQSRC